ncbi:MAG: asparaginase [Bacteroidota bacterium]|nr:asparaginase [Bacteroidota bacterium]
MKNLNSPNILLIYTGGTIGMIKDAQSGALKPFDFSKIRERISELEQLDCNINTISFDTPIDSSDMDIESWVRIVEIIEDNYQQYDGFVVLHGSDTMSYSASALSFMIENLDKPVIFTGSQLPIGDLRTDAKENLITAIQIACLQENGRPVVQEVCLYFEYKLYRANRTTKVNAEHFEAFESPNYPPLVESGVNLKVQHNVLLSPISGKVNFHKLMDSNIAVLKLFPNIQKKIVQAVLEVEGLKAIIIETYGSGNTTTQEWFVSLLEDAINRGIYIINVTQCLGGSVLQGKYQNSSMLKRIGVLSGSDVTTESALTKLMYLLSKPLTKSQFRDSFEKPLRGELTPSE